MCSIPKKEGITEHIGMCKNCWTNSFEGRRRISNCCRKIDNSDGKSPHCQCKSLQFPNINSAGFDSKTKISMTLKAAWRWKLCPIRSNRRSCPTISKSMRLFLTISTILIASSNVPTKCQNRSAKMRSSYRAERTKWSKKWSTLWYKYRK